MKLALIDCEYNEGGSRHPNPWLMKISSYYKQLGHTVSLVVKVNSPDSYDEIIIAKESNTEYLPPLSIVTLSKTKLIGKAFARHPSFWELPQEVYKARPDYGLYSFEFPSDRTGANFINLTYKGKLIPVQNHEQPKGMRPINYIIDRGIWESSELESVLNRLSGYNKIIFLEEVDLKKLNSPTLIKKFAELRFSSDQIKLKNVGSLEELEQVIFVIKEIQKIKRTAFTNINYITLPKNVPPQEAIHYYLDSIKAAAMMSKNTLVVNFLVPRLDKFESAFLFQDFRYFNNHRSSFFSYLLRRTGLTPERAMSNLTLWKSEPVNLIWKLYHGHRDVFEAGATHWGGGIDAFAKTIKEGEAKQFYDLYIL